MRLMSWILNIRFVDGLIVANTFFSNSPREAEVLSRYQANSIRKGRCGSKCLKSEQFLEWLDHKPVHVLDGKRGCAQGELLHKDNAELLTSLGCQNGINVYTTVSRWGFPIPVLHKVVAYWCLSKHPSLQGPQSTIFVQVFSSSSKTYLDQIHDILSSPNPDDALHTICKLDEIANCLHLTTL